MTTRWAVLGAGGHGKVALETVLATGAPTPLLLDDDPKKRGAQMLGIQISGPLSAAANDPGVDAAVVGVGDNATRQAIASRVVAPYAALVHPRAVVSREVELGPGAVVFAGAVVQPGARIGAHAVINTGATVDHDCHIGAYAHLGPGVHLSGEALIGEGALLGVGAAVAPGASVGDWTTVGAGGVVIGHLPARVVAVGVPAKPRKPQGGVP